MPKRIIKKLADLFKKPKKKVVERVPEKAASDYEINTPKLKIKKVTQIP